MEGSYEAFAAITTSVVTRGTTALVATTVSASEEVTCTAVEAVARWMDQQKHSETALGASEILGIHLEGPLVNPARRGAHSAEWIAAPSLAIFQRYLKAAKGRMCILNWLRNCPERPA